MMAKAFGVQTPTEGEDPVSWQTWSDGGGGIPNVVGNIDWGQLSVQEAGAEGRSAVYDLGSTTTRKFTLTENRYGSGSGSAALQIRGDTSVFTQDSEVVDWEDYTAPISRGWRYVQVRETTFTYYFVDATNGDDAHPGTRAEPWQTIAKVNGETFKPGDQILFKRGETWTDTRLRPPSSGVVGLPITFGAYGSGALPIIQLSAGSATECLYLDKNYLTVQNLHFINGVHTIEIDAADNIIIEDCTIEGDATARGNGISCYNGNSNLTFRRLTISGCKCPVGGGGGITGTGCTNITVEDCIIHDCGTSATLDHGIYFSNTTGYYIRRNTCYSNTADGIVISGITNGEITRNKCYLNGHYGIGFTGTISNVLCANNILYSNVSVGLMLEVGAVTAYIYHNTLVNNGTDMTHDNVQITTGTSGVIFKNNLSVYDKAVSGGDRFAINVSNNDILANNELDNNCYIVLNGTVLPQAVNGGDETLTTWRGHPGTPDVNGMNADPVFVTNYTNLHLQSSSPCRNAGEDGLVADDYDGVTRVAYDIGALEYVA